VSIATDSHSIAILNLPPDLLAVGTTSGRGHTMDVHTLWTRLRRRVLSPLLLGLMCAGLSFTWSLATTTTGTSPSPVVSGLEISNPFLGAGISPDFPNGGHIGSDLNAFALGDGCSGQAVNRQLSALNGFPPYMWTSTTASALGLALDISGRLTGQLGSAVASTLSFSAMVVDSSGMQRTGTFFFTQQKCNVFHFASDVLPLAAVGQDFITTLDVVDAPAPAVTYAVVPGSITLNGAAIPDLETAGFHLFSDGTFAGRPLNSGTLSFTASATSNGVRAARRDGSAPDQPLTLSISPENTLQSIMATRKLTVTAGNTGKDSLTLKALLVTGGFSAKAFNGKPFTLRIGTQIFTTTFGSNADKNFKTSFNNAQGLLQVQIRNQDFSKLLGAVPSGSRVRTVVQISLGNIFQSVEVLQLETRTQGNRFQLLYDLTRDTSLGGLFQITRLLGVNFEGSLVFQVNFVISPVGGAKLSADTATISIGPVFSQTIQLKNNHLSHPVGGMNVFNINAKRHTGVLLTLPLTPAAVGIFPNATGKAQAFLMRLDLNGASGPFAGTAAEVIGPNFSFPIFIPVIIVPVFDDDCFDDCGFVIVFSKKAGK
jgi:hypothetical protein